MIAGGLLGPVGQLEMLMFTESEPVEFASRRRARQALSGRTHVQVLPRAPRTWQCEIPHDAPQEGHVVDQSAAWWAENLRPVVWLPADSLGTNMLEPDAASMSRDWWSGLLPGAGAALPYSPEDFDGAPVTLTAAACRADGSWGWLTGIPVPRVATLTAAAYMTPFDSATAAELRVNEYDIAGELIGSAGSAYSRTARGRAVLTFETHPATATLAFAVRNASMVAAPSLTMTDKAMPWGVGRGCWSATVEVTGRDPLWTATGQRIYAAADSTSFTVQEVIR